jgi:hypothetical protein
MIRRGIAAITTIAAACAISGPAAASVPYDVYGCRLPDGSAAPIEGWTPSGAALGVYVLDTCGLASLPPERRALSGRFSSGIATGSAAAWNFAAPVDTTIANATLWRAVQPGPNAWPVAYWYLSSDEARAQAGPKLESCMDWEVSSCKGLGSFGNPSGAGNRADLTGLHAKQFNVILTCGGNAGYVCSGDSQFALFGTRMGLLDQIAPELGELSGDLISGAQPAEGTKSLTFKAADRGGGIRWIGLLVDGQERSVRPVDPLGAGCREPFTALVPCPTTAAPTVALDTASLDDGAHLVHAFATDVSGNRGLSAPFTVTTRNASYPNGFGATRAVRLSGRLTTVTGRRISRAVAYGTRAEIRGTLSTVGGAPIPGALVEITARTTRPGAAPHVRTATTDADGRFRYRLASGASRIIGVGYRAFTRDGAYAASTSATLRVRAAASLSLAPRVQHNGRVVTFSGRLRGGPYRKDASLILYALAGRGRIPVTSLRANSQGRFSFRYRFRTVTSPTRFRFEVQVESRPSYPYASGRSNTVSVLVRP